MTRIIAGVAGSLRLASPAKTTRPTSDRVRESIFSRLDSHDLLSGSAVLDLYAGTGALALEALSRGAKSAQLVESGKAAAAVCAKNAQAVLKNLANSKLDAVAKVHNQTVKAYLSSAPLKKFDLVFIDPPYEISNEELTHNLEDLAAALAEDFTVVVERSSRTEEPMWPVHYQLQLRKDYGDTSVYWLSHAS